ncbi:MAG: hypothetical protein ACREN8_06650 [Candidatus Dormibacteraceae bacterium]
MSLHGEIKKDQFPASPNRELSWRSNEKIREEVDRIARLVELALPLAESGRCDIRIKVQTPRDNSKRRVALKEICTNAPEMLSFLLRLLSERGSVSRYRNRRARRLHRASCVEREHGLERLGIGAWLADLAQWAERESRLGEVGS